MESDVSERRFAPRAVFSGIYGIVDLALTPKPLELAQVLLGAGVRFIQYRAKAGVDRALVRAMHHATSRAGGVLIVNDDLAAANDADGWHGGQEDLAMHDAAALRERLAGRILGISCGTSAEAREAEALGADYIGVGPFAATGTKRDAGPAIGAGGVARVVASTRVPVVAIGGIDASNIAAVAASGAAMAAVISAIALAPDPALAARTLVECWASEHRR
jgi:thiamine-phosphate pyrophosphorylase